MTSRGPARPPREGGRPRFIPRRKVCAFCVDKVTAIDYKSVERFGRYISDRARIEPRRKTGTCAGHQRMLAMAIKRARHLALLPFTQDHIRISGVMASRPGPAHRGPYHGHAPAHAAPPPPPPAAVTAEAAPPETEAATEPIEPVGVASEPVAPAAGETPGEATGEERPD